MNKEDLIRAAKKEWPSTEAMVNAIFREMNKALIRHETISINHFGQITVKKSNVKEVYDFKSGKRYPLGRKFNIKFKASPEVQKRVNASGGTSGPARAAGEEVS